MFAAMYWLDATTVSVGGVAWVFSGTLTAHTGAVTAMPANTRLCDMRFMCPPSLFLDPLN